MISFVDLHCHALFRVDDGAKDENMMKSMLDLAYSDGTRHLCFTPHFKIFEFNSEEEMYEQMHRLNRRFKIACEYVSEKYPDMHLYLGNEIMHHQDANESLSTKKCHYLGDSSYALIEFEPNASAYEIENSVLRLLRKGVRPVIAHIERYSAIVKDFSLVKSLKNSGALFQVNARSVTKFKFGKIAKFLRLAFKKGLIDVVASDAHNSTSFPPLLSKAYTLISKNYGQEYADSIFHSKPLAILKNDQIF